MASMKKCTKCHLQHEGKRSRCNPCEAEDARLWRSQNRERAREIVKNYQVRNPTRMSAHNRKFSLKKNYGIDEATYQSLLLNQGGRCAICGTDKPNGPSKKHFAIDHCHKSKKVRGLLCFKCNFIIGYAKESEEILLASISYLRRTAACS